MNNIYRVVFNHNTNTYQAVPEISTGKHKSVSEKSSCTQPESSGQGAIFSLKSRVLAALLMGFSGSVVFAAPTGGQVVAGEAKIAHEGKMTNIHQASQNAAINWQTFGINKGETVNFNQPNAQAVILNRVVGNEQSIINGAMNANGKVFISNPNGMLIGKDAQINVGSLVATTGKISDSDFMNGRYHFDQATGKITQIGNIKVPEGGVVALIAPIVENQGKIVAPQGKVVLGSAEKFSITLPENAQFAYTLDKGTLQGLVDNGGAILADGGHVVLTAKGVDSVKKSLIKHTGVIEANTVQNNNGVIELLGDLDHTRLEVSGTLKAEAKGADKGGFVETSASQVKIHDSAVVSTKSENGQSGKWLLDPNDLIVGAGGVMTGEQVGTALENNGDFELRSTNGKADGKGDVIINDEINWNKNKLTINAQNDIHINKTLTGTGTAKLALEYGQGTADGTYKAMVDGVKTILDNNYHLDKNTPLKDRTVKVNLPAGQTFSTKKGSNGETVVFNVIHQMPEIVKNADGDWESTFTTQNIAFGADMDVGYTKGYDGFAGWQLPKDSKIEWGRVAGLGHTVKDLSLHSKKDSQHTGLFQNQEVNFGYLRDIGVIDVNIRSDGKNAHTGGLAGYGVYISNSYATGNVSSTGENADTGGLAGYGNMISNSYATGDVSSAGASAETGGLVGEGHNISNSYATGNVSSTGDHADTGGLVGEGSGISNSYATGNVSSTGDHADTGGLVGEGSGIISNSYATGDVSSTGDRAYTGGLAGRQWYISNSYATGDVSSTGDYNNAGGLVGEVYNISNSYANNTSIKATGKDSTMAGLIAMYDNRYYDTHYYPGLKDSFFNQDKHPTLPAIVRYIYDHDVYKRKIVNVTGKTEAELKTKSTFTDAGWDFDKVWYMNDGEMPHLQAHKQGTIVITPTNPNKSDLAINAHDLKKTYDGKTVATESDLRAIAVQNGHTDIVSITGLKNGDSLDSLGTLRYDGTWKGAKDAGKYSILPTGLTGGQKYEIKYGEGSLTVGKRPTGVIATSVYDGKNTAKIYNEKDRFFDKQMTGFKDVVAGDDVALKKGTSVILSDSQVGKTTIKDLGSLSLTGKSANNYIIDTGNSSWTITKRPVKVTGSREYNGSEWINGADLNIDKSDIVGKDQILLNVHTGDVKLDGKDSKNGRKISDASKIYFGGKDGKNYEIDKSRSSVDITPRALSVSVSKDFDGSNIFKSNFIAGNLVNNEVVHISGQATVGSHKEGVYKNFSSHNLKIDNSNYQIGDVVNAEIKYLTIDPLNSGIYKEVTKYDELVYGKNRFKYDPDTHIRIYDDYELNRLPTDKLQEIVNTMRASGVLIPLPKEHRELYINIQYIINDAHHFDAQWDNIVATGKSWVSREGISVWAKTIVNMADATAILASNGKIDISKFNPDNHVIYKHLNILGNSDAFKRILDGGTAVLDKSSADLLRNMIYGGFDVYFTSNGTDQGRQIKEVTESLSKLMIALTQSNDVGATEAMLAVAGISAEIVSTLAPAGKNGVGGEIKVASKLVAIALDSINNGRALDAKANELFDEFNAYTNSYWDATRNYYNRDQLIETIRYNQQFKGNKNTVLLQP